MMTGHSRSNSISDDDNQSVQMEGTQKAKQKRPRMKKKSETWNHFTLLEDNPNKCKCNYCGRQYQCHSRRDGITNMRNHFIDSDWCLNIRIINFSVIEDHRGKMIDKKIIACLQDWGIERLF